jgi:hypothetical protein
MSHIVQIKTQVRDPLAIVAACQRLALPRPMELTAKLYDGSYTGWCVELPGWRYPVVCQPASGELKYDNFQGRWGAQQHLDRFLQAYAVEKAKLEARRQGHTIQEHALTNGSIKLTIQVTGGAT